MNYIEQPIRRMILKKPEIGLDPDASYRLGAQFRGMEAGRRAEAIEIANGLVPDILTRIKPVLSEGLPREEPVLMRWSGDMKYLMTAVHVLSIAGYDSNYGPVKNGEREISTRYPDLLKAVNSIFENMAESVGSKLRPQIMDEVGFSIYGVLRDDRDVRRQEERNKAVDVVRKGAELDNRNSTAEVPIKAPRVLQDA